MATQKWWGGLSTRALMQRGPICALGLTVFWSQLCVAQAASGSTAAGQVRSAASAKTSAKPETALDTVLVSGLPSAIDRRRTLLREDTSPQCVDFLVRGFEQCNPDA